MIETTFLLNQRQISNIKTALKKSENERDSRVFQLDLEMKKIESRSYLDLFWKVKAQPTERTERSCNFEKKIFSKHFFKNFSEFL